jgi:hypothetical protein
VHKFFQSNIGRYGRIARGVHGTLCLIAGIVLVDYVLWLGLLLVAAGLFVIIEALSGWSLALACDRRRKH